MPLTNPLTLAPIAFVESDFKEKFATPRQPGLVESTQAKVIFDPEYQQPDCVDGLLDFSHIWLIFGFHKTAHQGWKPKVRPPRLGGNAKLGVFATRSTFRPNPLGLSLVRLSHVNYQQGVVLHVCGTDLIDGTPIYDIKPYLPWVEAIPTASCGFAQEKPSLGLPVVFSDNAVAAIDSEESADLYLLIEQVLQQDPRPAYQKDLTRTYGCRLRNVNVQWQVHEDKVLVITVTQAD